MDLHAKIRIRKSTTLRKSSSLVGSSKNNNTLYSNNNKILKNCKKCFFFRHFANLPNKMRFLSSNEGSAVEDETATVFASVVFAAGAVVDGSCFFLPKLTKEIISLGGLE